MSFSLWGYLDQRWIDRKIEEYNIDSYEVIDRLEEFGFEGKQIIESPNPVIFVLIETIIDQLIEELESSFALSSDLQNIIREKLQETIFINSLDSHLDASEVLEEVKEEIQQELENSELVELDQLGEIMEKAKLLFGKYDF